MMFQNIDIWGSDTTPDYHGDAFLEFTQEINLQTKSDESYPIK